MFNFASQTLGKAAKFGSVAVISAGLALTAPIAQADMHAASNRMVEATAPGGAPQSFADLVEKLSPSVVNISTSQKVEQTASRDMPRPIRRPEASPWRLP